MSETPSAESQTIDARGLACPQPVLLLRQAMKSLQPTQRLMLLTTDPMASVDVRAYCARSGNALRREQDEGTHTRFLVERC